ncbi:MAG: arylesterase [Sulfurimonadaceae bacterium]|nr:arylesterase [Sulfurimonadaceae bacterium]
MKKFAPFIIMLVVVTALLILGKNAPEHSESAKAYQQRPILAFGDSLTFGLGAQPYQSYPAMLQRMSGVKVINAGVSGEVSGNGLKRLNAELEQHQPALLILCHGGNDILRGLSKEALKTNLSAMVRLAKQKDIDVLVVGMPDLSALGFRALPLYKEVANEHDTMYESGIIGKIMRNTGLKSDRIHPNAEGYRLMAEAFYDVLKEEGRL